MDDCLQKNFVKAASSENSKNASATQNEGNVADEKYRNNKKYKAKKSESCGYVSMKELGKIMGEKRI